MDHLEKERLIQTLQEENEKFKRLLHDLTPGGSEFYNDPEYCAKWIRENRDSERKTLKEIVKRLKLELSKFIDIQIKVKQS